jgi:hypothetical protein
MFKWDGTDVTNIVTMADIFESKFNKNKYWVIQYTNPETNEKLEETCIMRVCKNSLPYLIDELKPVFGLQKMGTHWCRQGGKNRILIKTIKTQEGYIKEEITLDMIDRYTNLMKLQVQEIFAFRELLGVTCSYNSSIVIRESKSGYYPVSFYEPNMVTVDKKVIPFSVLDKWFDDSTIDTVVKRLCRIHSIDQMGNVLHDIRTRIEKTIERVDRRAISYKTCIVNRITERLQTTLS